MKNKYKCMHCGLDFEEKTRCANKYCSTDCYHSFKQDYVDEWFDCSVCIASVGFGCKTAGKLLGVNHYKISNAWKKKGVTTKLPAIGSWYMWAKRKAAGKDPDRKRTDYEVLYDRARMEDIKQACKSGFNWSCEWTKEMAKRTAKVKYDAMTPEEKKIYNKRCVANKNKRWDNNPKIKARDIAIANDWKRRNPQKNRESVKKWIKNNPEKHRENQRLSRKKRMDNDPAYRALCNQKSRFKRMMKSVKNGGCGAYSSNLGCTTEQFRKHMESNFSSKMSWDNYGTYWHDDHILPCASFDHNDTNQIKTCWHWTNLQPLEAKKNLAKSDNIEDPQMSLMINFVFDA